MVTEKNKDGDTLIRGGGVDLNVKMIRYRIVGGSMGLLPNWVVRQRYLWVLPYPTPAHM